MCHLFNMIFSNYGILINFFAYFRSLHVRRGGIMGQLGIYCTTHMSLKINCSIYTEGSSSHIKLFKNRVSLKQNKSFVINITIFRTALN